MDIPSGIMIQREGKQYGPYTFEETAEYLQTGRLSISDTAWDPKSGTWTTLGLIRGIKWVAPAPQSAPPPPRQAGPSGRNVVILIVVGFFWWMFFCIVPFIVACAGAGFVAGLLPPENGAAAGSVAGAAVGSALGFPLFVGSLVLTIWMTAKGMLPGTRK
jgi:hypothetical protein